MSNLGSYQFLTTFASKVGGPVALMIELIGTGALIGAGTIKVVQIRKEKERNNSTEELKSRERGVDGKAINLGDGSKLSIFQRKGEKMNVLIAKSDRQLGTILRLLYTENEKYEVKTIMNEKQKIEFHIIVHTDDARFEVLKRQANTIVS